MDEINWKEEAEESLDDMAHLIVNALYGGTDAVNDVVHLLEIIKGLLK